MSDPVIIENYDPEWPQQFALLRSRIAPVLGRLAPAVEHVGSTAVPGLAAKPIIDILVSVKEVEDERAYLARLKNAGYVLRVPRAGPPDVRRAY